MIIHSITIGRSFLYIVLMCCFIIDRSVLFMKVIKRKHFLIGHCYNPFTNEYEESAIVKRLSEQNDETYWDYLNQLTGNFITGFEDLNGRISFTCDATAMMSAFYGTAGKHFYISNYSYLIGEMANLKFEPYVEDLIHYKHYHYLEECCLVICRRIVKSNTLFLIFRFNIRTERSLKKGSGQSKRSRRIFLKPNMKRKLNDVPIFFMKVFA